MNIQYGSYNDGEYITDDGSKDESGTGLITLDIDTIGTGGEKWEWISK